MNRQRFLTRLAIAVLQQADADLDSDDEAIRRDAEVFLFGEDETHLLCWLLRAGCRDVEAFRGSLERKRKKLAA